MAQFSFRVDPSSAEPLFAQIVSGVKHAVATGRLAPGDRLPSVRELARELVINPNTIAKAYEALEAEGITLSRHGAGTFIAERRAVLSGDEQRRRIREALTALLTDAVHLGLRESDVRREFDAALHRFRFDTGGDDTGKRKG
ncbi:MAG: GntR family transcriptional regulator [Planctomycetes bacterium]|nr:GntR family transcriptional regulator [Planctomycetota bacterium]